ncbi:MAG TPA: DUF2281 domain-containing protein [Terriglobia bacterium]|nr:DUF2281 domain-containing protein [Terriglobia bacterium]
MAKQSKTLEQLVKELPPDRQDEARDFLERLVGERHATPSGKPGLKWAGALADLKDRYTSVDLQHRIARWRIEGD